MNRRIVFNMCLAEVAPDLARHTHWTSTGMPSWDSSEYTNTNDDPRRKAVRLTALRLHGPDCLVVCPVHRITAECAGVPVAWALLGYTCGLA